MIFGLPTTSRCSPFWSTHHHDGNFYTSGFGEFHPPAPFSLNINLTFVDSSFVASNNLDTSHGRNFCLIFVKSVTAVHSELEHNLTFCWFYINSLDGAATNCACARETVTSFPRLSLGGSALKVSAQGHARFFAERFHFWPLDGSVASYLNVSLLMRTWCHLTTLSDIDFVSLKL